MYLRELVAVRRGPGLDPISRTDRGDHRRPWERAHPYSLFHPAAVVRTPLCKRAIAPPALREKSRLLSTGRSLPDTLSQFPKSWWCPSACHRHSRGALDRRISPRPSNSAVTSNLFRLRWSHSFSAALSVEPSSAASPDDWQRCRPLSLPPPRLASGPRPGCDPPYLYWYDA